MDPTWCLHPGVQIGTRRECTDAVAILAEINLDVVVVDLTVVAQQHVVGELFEWLHYLCTISPGLRRVVCSSLVEEPTRPLSHQLDTSSLTVRAARLSASALMPWPWPFAACHSPACHLPPAAIRLLATCFSPACHAPVSHLPARHVLLACLPLACLPLVCHLPVLQSGCLAVCLGISLCHLPVVMPALLFVARRLFVHYAGSNRTRGGSNS